MGDMMGGGQTFSVRWALLDNNNNSTFCLSIFLILHRSQYKAASYPPVDHLEAADKPRDQITVYDYAYVQRQAELDLPYLS